ncbi:histidine phosphatase family protein [Aquimarina sp. W85]|uniref:SixA phosphatase family protein n=1 Tax=Aquimarina rhodophyticola TaxID=3342246 RepID=UPI00366F8932
MKKLVFIRHAKSSWEFDVIDHQRPLKKRGIQDATLIGKYLKNLELTVDKVLCSDAKRTQMTAAIILEAMNLHQVDFALDTNLYDFTGEQVMETIVSTKSEINTLMLFGHNYALTRLANMLGNKVIDNIPTAGVVVIDFENTQWNTINVGKTLLTIFPKDLR